MLVVVLIYEVGVYFPYIFRILYQISRLSLATTPSTIARLDILIPYVAQNMLRYLLAFESLCSNL